MISAEIPECLVSLGFLCYPSSSCKSRKNITNNYMQLFFRTKKTDVKKPATELQLK